MRNRKKIIIIALVMLLGLSSCGFEAQPPKTGGSDSQYVLPAGELPSQEELQEVEQAKAEYEAAIKK
ncbi:MAG: hypothetical protein PUB91_02470 [Bacteroidales bacterium]|nr:hypothetical protein [Bacteroidales bacterium]